MIAQEASQFSEVDFRALYRSTIAGTGWSSDVQSEHVMTFIEAGAIDTEIMEIIENWRVFWDANGFVNAALTFVYHKGWGIGLIEMLTGLATVRNEVEIEHGAPSQKGEEAKTE